MLNIGERETTDGCLVLDNYIDIDSDVVNKIIKPYLGGNPEGVVILGQIDIMKVVVQRMIVSLIDKYPKSEWWFNIQNKKYLHPTLLLRTNKS